MFTRLNICRANFSPPAADFALFTLFAEEVAGEEVDTEDESGPTGGAGLDVVPLFSCIRRKYVWVWNKATRHARSESCKNLCCVITIKLSTFALIARQFLMQDRHDRTLTESVMLSPTYQTSWVMENLHDKSGILPDPDIFAFDILLVPAQELPPRVFLHFEPKRDEFGFPEPLLQGCFRV